MQSICVIGGTRFFGKTVVSMLVAAGHRVTLASRGHAAYPLDGIGDRIVVDANDAEAMCAAFAGRRFDVVLHQVCYSPLAALAACSALAGRVGRLVMTSTIEVYNPASFTPPPPFGPYAREDELRPELQQVDLLRPWNDTDYRGAHYAEGKRQAEAALARNATFPVAFVRVAHVLAARGDFTGRLQFHIDRIRSGAPIASWRRAGRTTFVASDDIAAFLAWSCVQRFTGPVNAGAPIGVSVDELCELIAVAAGAKARIQEVADPRGLENLSPFSYPQDYCMSVQRASELGYRFAGTESWLPGLIHSALA